MSLIEPLGEWAEERAPRVSGDEPDDVDFWDVVAQCSPRERG